MKNVVIEKRVGALECLSDISILFDERPKAVLKKEDGEISIPVSSTQVTVQAEIVLNGRSYRSNAYFVLNGKCPRLFLEVSGTKLVLTTK